jgi:Glycosyl hydrolase family 47
MNSLAGAGTVTLEFSTLSSLTNDSSYAAAADRAVKVLYTRRNNRELFGRYINVTTGHWILEDAAGIGHCTDRCVLQLLEHATVQRVEVVACIVLLRTYVSVLLSAVCVLCTVAVFALFGICMVFRCCEHDVIAAVSAYEVLDRCVLCICS